MGMMLVMLYLLALVSTTTMRQVYGTNDVGWDLVIADTHAFVAQPKIDGETEGHPYVAVKLSPGGSMCGFRAGYDSDELEPKMHSVCNTGCQGVDVAPWIAGTQAWNAIGCVTVPLSTTKYTQYIIQEN